VEVSSRSSVEDGGSSGILSLPCRTDRILLHRDNLGVIKASPYRFGAPLTSVWFPHAKTSYRIAVYLLALLAGGGVVSRGSIGTSVEHAAPVFESNDVSGTPHAETRERDREFESRFLLRRVCKPPVPQRCDRPHICRVERKWDQRFESAFLQR
jgi:hypothetical protein